MGGLSRVAKIYGGMTIIGKDGKEVEWLFDYVQDKSRLKSEMSKAEIKASEKRRLELIKQQNGTD